MYRAAPSDGIAWVTGASSGIGRAVALELVRRGYKVAVTARRADELAALAAATPGLFAFPGDITDRAAMAAVVAAIAQAHGPIALALLNAGVYDPAERKAFSAEVVWRTFEVNVGGTVNGLDPLIARMLAQGRGQIAITASLAGYGGIPGSLAYGATKAALIYMAEALRLTYEGKGLTIQVVNPGFVRSAMTARNDFFKMPLLMDVETAATRICDGFVHGGFEITFPRRLAYAFKAVCLLPYAAFFAVLGRGTKRVQRSDR